MPESRFYIGHFNTGVSALDRETGKRVTNLLPKEWRQTGASYFPDSEKLSKIPSDRQIQAYLTKKVGKGWHGQKIRHSNARRFHRG